MEYAAPTKQRPPTAIHLLARTLRNKKAGGGGGVMSSQ